MKKILFVINTMGVGGAEAAMIALLKRLSMEDVELSCYVLTGQGELASRLPDGVQLKNREYSYASVLSGEGRRRLAGTVIRAFFRNGHLTHKFGILARNLRAMARGGRIQADKLLWRILAEGGERFEEYYDLAVAFLEGGSAYYVAEHVEAARKAVFIHIDYAKAGYSRELDGGCYDSFQRIFAVSDSVREQFLKVYPEYRERTFTLPNLIDSTDVVARSQEDGGFADSFDGIRLLTVGRLTRQKGYDIALDALKLLVERGNNVRWYVLGEGEERDFLERKAARLKLQEHFRMLGTVENPFPYYAQADIYVHATRYEGKSIALREAQILGCAIVASDCGGNRELVTDHEDGILCCLTPEGIADGIEEFLRSPRLREKLGTSAREKGKIPEGDISGLLDFIFGEDGNGMGEMACPRTQLG